MKAAHINHVKQAGNKSVWGWRHQTNTPISHCFLLQEHHNTGEGGRQRGAISRPPPPAHTRAQTVHQHGLKSLNFQTSRPSLPVPPPTQPPALPSSSPPPALGRRGPCLGLGLQLISSAHLEAGCRLAGDSGGRGLNLLSGAAMRHSAGPGGPWPREPRKHAQHDLMKVNLLAKTRPSCVNKACWCWCYHSSQSTLKSTSMQIRCISIR